MSAVSWRTPGKNKPSATRPGFVVALRTKRSRRPTLHQDWGQLPATGHLRVFRRSPWPAYIVGPAKPCRMKHHNSGIHLYWTLRKIRSRITDGTVKRFPLERCLPDTRSIVRIFGRTRIDISIAFASTNVASTRRRASMPFWQRRRWRCSQTNAAFASQLIRAAGIFCSRTGASNSSSTKSTSTPIRILRRSREPHQKWI